MRRIQYDNILETIEGVFASQDPQKALKELIKALGDSDATIRYWAATGLGNVGIGALSGHAHLVRSLKDTSVCVRIAVARALCRMNQPQQALPVLMAAMEDDNQWARLQAAIVLDNINEMARPAEAVLKQALADQPNKYITRVANRALNVMNGTENTVK